MDKKLLISVVVCTYNRLSLLRRCLDSLENQSIQDKFYEVLIIDNNPTDKIKGLVRHFTEKNRNFRLAKERKQGLSFARNKGFQEARGNFVAYIDDDAIANRDWVREIFNFINKKPGVKVFGGPYYPYFLREKPNWFPESWGKFSLGDEVKKVDVPRESLSGSNIIFSRSLLRKVGGFKTDLGMRGDKVAYGEETRLLIEISKMGYDIYYVPSIKVEHLVSEKKFSLSWMFKNHYVIGRKWAKTHDKKYEARVLIKHFFRSIRNIFKVLLLSEIKPFKKRLYYAFKDFFSQVGSIVEYMSVEYNRS